MPSDSSRAASTRARNAPATQVRGAIRTRPSMTECYDAGAPNLRPMPRARPRFTGALCALMVLAVRRGGRARPGTAFATRGRRARPRCRLGTWAATFCTAFAAYEKDALAAQQKTQVAFAGVQDATEGATATAALGDAFTATQRLGAGRGDGGHRQRDPRRHRRQGSSPTRSSRPWSTRARRTPRRRSGRRRCRPRRRS